MHKMTSAPGFNYPGSWVVLDFSCSSWISAAHRSSHHAADAQEVIPHCIATTASPGDLSATPSAAQHGAFIKNKMRLKGGLSCYAHRLSQAPFHIERAAQHDGFLGGAVGAEIYLKAGNGHFLHRKVWASHGDDHCGCLVPISKTTKAAQQLNQVVTNAPYERKRLIAAIRATASHLP
eukprot:1158846-Pelagomonas_calceolata.AAC.6